MPTTFQCSFDATDPHRLADFWAAALGYEVEDVDAGCREMLAKGLATDADVEEIDGRMRWRDGTAINSPDGASPRFYIQRVPEPKTAKNRLHLDLHVPDRETEATRLEALGATRLYEGSQGPHHWLTMADPEGNEFCVA